MLFLMFSRFFQFLEIFNSLDFKTCSEPQILVAQSSLEALDSLVKGLKSEFTSYVGNVIPVVVSKCKEKRSQILKSFPGLRTKSL